MKKAYLAGFVIVILIIIVSIGGKKTLKKESNNSNAAISKNEQSQDVTEAPSIADGNDKSNISLNVSEPADNITLSNQNLTIRGTTAQNADVFVNDIELKADKNGKFWTSINLDEGENTISIVVNDENGNSGEKDLTVTYEPQIQN